MSALHRKENHLTGCWKNASHSLNPAFPGGTTYPPPTKGMKIPQLSRISRNTSSGRIPAARIS